MELTHVTGQPWQLVAQRTKSRRKLGRLSSNGRRRVWDMLPCHCPNTPSAWQVLLAFAPSPCCKSRFQTIDLQVDSCTNGVNGAMCAWNARDVGCDKAMKIRSAIAGSKSSPAGHAHDATNKRFWKRNAMSVQHTKVKFTPYSHMMGFCKEVCPHSWAGETNLICAWREGRNEYSQYHVLTTALLATIDKPNPCVLWGF